MIATLLIWIYAGALCLLYGAAALRLLETWLKASTGAKIEVPLQMIVGMGLVTTLATTLSLFMPLGPAAGTILLVTGALLAFAAGLRLTWRARWPRGTEWIPVLVMLVGLLFCLENATQAPANPDTNSYHAQTIRWIETYAAVPGLGNLYGRLAYNSSWLLLNAAFSFWYLELRSFHVIGGLLFLAALLYFVAGLRKLVDGHHSVGNWMRVAFIPASFWVLAGELSSPGTDLPAILLTWILLCTAVDLQESSGKDGALGIVMAALAAITTVFKLSAAPILLLSLYLLLRWIWHGQGKKALTALIVMAAIGAPWMARSAILSGYLVYPYPQVDVFNVDWKVPAADVESVRNGILGWARIPDSNWADTVLLPLSQWMPEWFRERTVNQLALLGLALLAPLGLGLPSGRRLLPPVLAAYAAMLVWLLGAPNWRFGYGVVLGLAAFVIAAAITAVAQRGPVIITSGLGRAAAAAISAYLVVAFAGSMDGPTLGKRLVLPVDYYPSRATTCDVDGLPMYCATIHLQCSYFAFPCVPSVSQTTHARGTQLQDGFYSAEWPAAVP